MTLSTRSKRVDMAMTGFQKKLLLGLFIMALLSPIGLLLPEKFDAEDAWGEWGIEKIEKMLGYVPAGMKKIAGLWKAPVPDYNFGGEASSLKTHIVSYIASGVLGIALAGAVVFILSKFLVRHKRDDNGK